MFHSGFVSFHFIPFGLVSFRLVSFRLVSCVTIHRLYVTMKYNEVTLLISPHRYLSPPSFIFSLYLSISYFHFIHFLSISLSLSYFIFHFFSLSFHYVSLSSFFLSFFLFSIFLPSFFLSFFIWICLILFFPPLFPFLLPLVSPLSPHSHTLYYCTTLSSSSSPDSTSLSPHFPSFPSLSLPLYPPPLPFPLIFPHPT